MSLRSLALLCALPALAFADPMPMPVRESPPVTIAKLPQQTDVFVSTGDNHFLGSSCPIDSPESIAATLDLFQQANHAHRIYWRGLEEATWVETMQARPENPRYFSLWQWMQWLYANVKPDEVAVQAAHARGMEIWGVGTMFDWGGPADTPTFGDYPFPFISKLKLEHPEWSPIDKHGVRRQGGPIELAYPEARHALVDLHLRKTLEAGYDGITFLTYAENYSMRFQDEFGFSDPIAADFQRLFRLDLRHEPFRRGASREDWLRLRGSYVTAYLRELHTALAKNGKKLGVILNGNDIHAPQTWNVPELMCTAGSMEMDVETWVREGLVDNLTVYGNCARSAQAKAIESLLWECRQTGVEVTFLTSSPLDPGWAPLYLQGARSVLSVSDETQHLARSFIPAQTVEALHAAGEIEQLKALQQIVDGDLPAGFDDVALFAHARNLLERRLALLALAKISASAPAPALPIIEAALDDPENGVRCEAALALGNLAQPSSTAALLRALDKHANHMLEECVLIALRKLKPFPLAEIAAGMDAKSSVPVRRTCARALIHYATPDQVTVLRAGLADPDRFTAVASAEALGNLRHTGAATMPLIGALSSPDVAVAARAAVSLGEIAARKEPETATVRQRMLEALKLDFERFGKGCDREDADWGYRPVGNALRAFRKDGLDALEDLRFPALDPLADRVWRVLDLHQEPNTFSEVSEEENESAHAMRLCCDDPIILAPGRSLHVDPLKGDDKSDGITQPCKTIKRAIALAQPADTIHLAPGTYYEVADFTNKHGELDRPITLDGHGATLEETDPCTSKEWEQISPGLFRKQHLMPHIDDAIIQRWFFLWDGWMNHMGRTSKGLRPPFKPVADLQPGEWSYQAAEDTFYLKLAPGVDLDAANIRYPARGNGVAMGLSCSHVLIKNLVCAHPYNDGCNIHGLVRDARFENIFSFECGDDGFSAHDDCQCEIDGFISVGNSTGFADAGSSVTHYRHVLIRDCLGVDVLILGDGKHSLTDAVVLSGGHTALSEDPTSGNGRRPARLTFTNVLFRRVTGAPDMRIQKGTAFTADHCTFAGVTFPKGSDPSLVFKDSRLGDPAETGGGADLKFLHKLYEDMPAAAARWRVDF